MKQFTHAFKSLVSVCAFAGLLMGCTLKGTTNEITDTTSNVTGTTSGKSWFTGDGLVKHDQKIELFAQVNSENLMRDLAWGQGEYIASLASLLGVPEDRQDHFTAMMQTRANSLLALQEVTPTEMSHFTAGLLRDRR